MGDENAKSSRLETAINRVEGQEANFLAQYIEEDDSLDSLQEHRIVPRFKIIQATSDSELTENFGIGSVIVRPGDSLISKFKEEPKSFEFVPLFFFVEWAKWRDLKDTGPMILERSHDPSSYLAENSKDAKTRKELYPNQSEALPEKEKKYYSYVEHLRFIGLIYGDHPLAGTPVTLSFERGEYMQGKNFISAVTLRRQVVNGKPSKIPLWSQVWKLSTIHHTPDATRKWYGFKFEAADTPVINQEEAADMKALHLEFKELFEKQRLMVQDEEDDTISADEAAVKANEDF
jgi:hypothetical protein